MFASEEFHLFLMKNTIKHVLTPPYYPVSNGLAEQAVQIFKEGMQKLRKGSLWSILYQKFYWSHLRTLRFIKETRLAQFLFKDRITPQSSTGVAPAELMFGRRLLSHLDNVHPVLSRKAWESQEQQKQGHNSRA